MSIAGYLPKNRRAEEHCAGVQYGCVPADHLYSMIAFLSIVFIKVMMMMMMMMMVSYGQQRLVISDKVSPLDLP